MKLLTDQQEITRLMESARGHDLANHLKQLAWRDGFRYWMSLYGVLTEQTTQHSEYRRIEVLSNVPYNGTTVELIYRFFQNIKPVEYYTIWLYFGKDKSIVQAGAY
jgi:hypothetical protein